MNRADLASEIQTAMAAVWAAMAKIVAVVVSIIVVDVKTNAQSRTALSMRRTDNSSQLYIT